MPNYLIRNQTPEHVELHGKDTVLLLSPLQSHRLGKDPHELYGDNAVAARRDEVVNWSPEPTRSALLKMASLLAAVGIIALVLSAVGLLRDHVLLGASAGALAAACLVGAAVAIRVGQETLLPRTRHRPWEAEPERPAPGFLELLQDLALSAISWSGLVLLVAVGMAVPAVAIYYGTDLSTYLVVKGGQLTVVGGDRAHRVLVVRGLQMALLVLVSLIPALMYYQFDRERLSTMVDRWLHVIFRLDPTLRTVADVDAKYGRRVEELLGASLDMGQGAVRKRLRDRSPVVLSTLLIAVGWIVVMLSVPSSATTGAEPTVADMFHPVLTPATMAFLGAYFLSVQVVLRGFVRGDLKTKTYNVITVRIIIAVVLAWALESLFGDSETVLAASFLSGVVPSTVLLLIRNSSGLSKATTDADLDRRSPLTQIDEIDVYERTRLEEEGITSVQALARADLVDLMLSSRIPAARLIDWVDQAMLQQHTTEQVTKALRSHGVRSATDLLQVCDDDDARAELDVALTGACSVHLLEVVLRHDEWLGYIQHWREHQDAHSAQTRVYDLPTVIDLDAQPVASLPRRAPTPSLA